MKSCLCVCVHNKEIYMWTREEFYLMGKAEGWKVGTVGNPYDGNPRWISIPRVSEILKLLLKYPSLKDTCRPGGLKLTALRFRGTSLPHCNSPTNLSSSASIREHNFLKEYINEIRGCLMKRSTAWWEEIDLICVEINLYSFLRDQFVSMWISFFRAFRLYFILLRFCCIFTWLTKILWGKIKKRRATRTKSDTWKITVFNFCILLKKKLYQKFKGRNCL